MNVDKLKYHFNSDFIDRLCNLNKDYIDFLTEKHPRKQYRTSEAIPFFRQLGNLDYVYDHLYVRNKAELESTLYEHMKNILYSPNLSILDFVIENYDEFKTYTFLDFACGSGILSIFLNELKIHCYNYDTNSEIGMEKETSDDDFSQFTFTHFYNKRTNNNINAISDSVIYDYECLSCCGYYFSESFLIGKVKYLFLDGRYNSRYNPTDFDLIKSYSNNLNVYKRIS